MDVVAPIAAAERATVVLGVNVDDLGDHRPGQRAATEAGAAFPLVAAGFTKADVRAASRRLGLRTWDKPAAACLASRVPYGTEVTVTVLSRVERAEAVLRALGLRARCASATTTTRPASRSRRPSWPPCWPQREAVVAGVRAAGYRYVTLDLEGFRSGNLNALSALLARSRVGAMKLAMCTQLLGRLPRRRHPRPGAREGRSRRRVGGRGVLVRRHQPGRLPRRQDRAGRDRHRDHQRVLADRDGDRPDRRRLRLRQRRPLHPRPRRLRPAGDRGLPRRAVRAPDAAHPRVHRGLPDGLEARAGRLRRPDHPGPAAGRPGHRARQAAEADQPPEALRHPGVLGQPDGHVRGRDGAGRQRLAADLLRPREVPAGVGRRPRRAA